jgi:CHAD domain-containing protein
LSELTRDLLERPPEETARLLALSFLEEAADGAERMRLGEDPEALHDFRVGLRRLRSCLRAYRPYLAGSVSKKLRRRLKALASSTNQARDTEVQLEWLTPQIDKLTSQQQIGARWLNENLITRQSNSEAPSLEKVLEEFHKLRKDFRERLTICAFRLDPGNQEDRPTFLSTTGGLLVQQAKTLEKELSEIESVNDDEKIHQARISGKRLRYLLEPLRKEVPGTKALVKSMKNLQDVLGELHDAKVMNDELSSSLRSSAVDRARKLQETLEREVEIPSEVDWDERYGLLELLRLSKERSHTLFEKANRLYQGDKGRSLFNRLEEMGRLLGDGDGELDRSRRFILSRLPERAKGAKYVLIEEGWLPGRPARECLKRERSKGKLTYSRITRAESDSRPVVEKLSRRYFTTLWPLTEKRRTRKRVYEVPEGASTWLIHAFLDRDLVLAEQTRIPPGATNELPGWLAPLVKREVTDIKKYENVALTSIAKSSREPSSSPSTVEQPPLIHE